MKKIFTIFLLVIYTGSAFGIPVDFHYCKGQLTGVALANFGTYAGCGCNDSKMPMGCCKDKVFYNKADNHNTNQASAIINPLFVQLDLPQICYLKNEILNRNSNSQLSYFQPSQRSCLQPIYLLIRVFRI